MDVRLSRSAIARQVDPHGWCSYDNYRTTHETRLRDHYFVDDSRLDTITFEFFKNDGALFVVLQGTVYCRGGIQLEVQKILETKYKGRHLHVKGLRYKYIARIVGENLILKYHNLHENRDDYIHRVFNPKTGEEIGSETLRRYQFPLFSEILDELSSIMEMYGDDGACICE